MNKLVAEVVDMVSREGTEEEVELNKLVEEAVDQVAKCDDVVTVRGIVDGVEDRIDVVELVAEG